MADDDKTPKGDEAPQPEANPQRRLGLFMSIGMWIIVLALLTVFLQSWQKKQHNPNQHAAVSGTEQGPQTLRLQRNRYGHYVASGLINQQAVVFLLDTGASDVSIPETLARQMGLSRGRAMQYQTANGTITVYRTTLTQVNLGGLILSDIKASINPYMQGNEVLLGMSFLKHLEFSQRGDTLTLRQY
jgi:aspartyl protease family protein